MLKSKTKKIYINNKCYHTFYSNYILLSLVMCLLAAIGTYNNLIAVIFSAIEIAVLLIMFLKGDVKKYIVALLFIFSSSIETAIFVRGTSGEPLYSFFNLPIIRGYHSYIFQFLPVLMILWDNQIGKFMRILKEKYPRMNIFVRGFFILSITSVFMMLICIFMEDNGGFASGAIRLYTRRDVLQYGGLNLLLLYFTYCVVLNEDFKGELICIIHSILIGLSLMSIISTLLGMRGLYGEVGIQLAPLSSFYAVTLIVFSMYRKYGGMGDFILGILALLVTIKVPNGYAGKWWLYLGLVLLVTGRLLVYRLTKKRLLAILGGILLLGCILGVSNLDSNISEDNNKNELAMNKLYQAKSLVMFWKEDWYKNMSGSPKFRLEEFINIGLELECKPQYMILGKGYGGSLSKHWGDLDWNIKGDGSFSDIEIDERTYIKVHESFNNFFLKYGLLGLLFLCWICITCLFSYKNNPFILPGLFWIAILYGASDTLLIGAVCLVLGLFLSEKNQV